MLQQNLLTELSCCWILPRRLNAPDAKASLLKMVEEAVHVVEVERPPTRRVQSPAMPSPPAPQAAGRVTGSFEEIAQSLFDTSQRPGPIRSMAPSPGRSHGGPPLAERVANAVERYLGESVGGADDPVARLAAHRIPDGLAVVVHADDEPDPDELTALMRRYAVAARPAVGSRAPVPALLLVGTTQAIPAVDHLDPLTTAVHWWWGVVRRLDLLVVLGEQESCPEGRQRLLDELCVDLRSEVVAEVAGPDLDLAVHLGRTWDGSRHGLTRAVLDHVAVAGIDGLAEAAESTGESAGLAPPRRLREAWSAGLVDLWDGRIRATPCTLPKDAIDKAIEERLWIGQARALNTLLEHVRRQIVDLVRSTASARTIAQLDIEYCNRAGAETIELNHLLKAARQGLVQLDRQTFELLQHAVVARNKLAHREAVDDARLDALHTLLSSAVGHKIADRGTDRGAKCSRSATPGKP